MCAVVSDVKNDIENNYNGGVRNQSFTILNDEKLYDNENGNLKLSTNLNNIFSKSTNSIYHKNCIIPNENFNILYNSIGEKIQTDNNNNLKFNNSNSSNNRDFFNKVGAKLKSLTSRDFIKKRKITATTIPMSETEKIQKPNFITTVKSGSFLEPPPDIAILLGLQKKDNNSRIWSPPSPKSDVPKIVYSYSSKPTILKSNHKPPLTPNSNLSNNRKKRNAPKYLDDDLHASHYGNTMFDRRVARGSNFSTCQHPLLPKWNNYFGNAKQLSSNEVEINTNRQSEAARRTMVRQRAQQRVRRISQRTPPPVDGRKHLHIQTENIMEELIDKRPEYTKICQANLSGEEMSTYISNKETADVETQTDSNDLYDSEPDTSIISVLVKRIIEESVIDITRTIERPGLNLKQDLTSNYSDDVILGKEQLSNLLSAAVERLKQSSNTFTELDKYLENFSRLQTRTLREIQRTVTDLEFITEITKKIIMKVYHSSADSGDQYDESTDKIDQSECNSSSDETVIELRKNSLTVELENRTKSLDEFEKENEAIVENEDGITKNNAQIVEQTDNVMSSEFPTKNIDSKIPEYSEENEGQEIEESDSIERNGILNEEEYAMSMTNNKYGDKKIEIKKSLAIEEETINKEIEDYEESIEKRNEDNEFLKNTDKDSQGNETENKNVKDSKNLTENANELNINNKDHQSQDDYGLIASEEDGEKEIINKKEVERKDIQNTELSEINQNEDNNFKPMTENKLQNIEIEDGDHVIKETKNNAELEDTKFEKQMRFNLGSIDDKDAEINPKNLSNLNTDKNGQNKNSQSENDDADQENINKINDDDKKEVDEKRSNDFEKKTAQTDNEILQNKIEENSKQLKATDNLADGIQDTDETDTRVGIDDISTNLSENLEPTKIRKKRETQLNFDKNMHDIDADKSNSNDAFASGTDADNEDTRAANERMESPNSEKNIELIGRKDEIQNGSSQNDSENNNIKSVNATVSVEIKEDKSEERLVSEDKEPANELKGVESEETFPVSNEDKESLLELKRDDLEESDNEPLKEQIGKHHEEFLPVGNKDNKLLKEQRDDESKELVIDKEPLNELREADKDKESLNLLKEDESKKIIPLNEKDEKSLNSLKGDQFEESLNNDVRENNSDESLNFTETEKVNKTLQNNSAAAANTKSDLKMKFKLKVEDSQKNLLVNSEDTQTAENVELIENAEVLENVSENNGTSKITNRMNSKVYEEADAKFKKLSNFVNNKKEVKQKSENEESNYVETLGLKEEKKNEYKESNSTQVENESETQNELFMNTEMVETNSVEIGEIIVEKETQEAVNVDSDNRKSNSIDNTNLDMLEEETRDTIFNSKKLSNSVEVIDLENPELKENEEIMENIPANRDDENIPIDYTEPKKEEPQNYISMHSSNIKLTNSIQNGILNNEQTEEINSENNKESTIKSKENKKLSTEEVEKIHSENNEDNKKSTIKRTDNEKLSKEEVEEINSENNGDRNRNEDNVLESSKSMGTKKFITENVEEINSENDNKKSTKSMDNEELNQEEVKDSNIKLSESMENEKLSGEQVEELNIQNNEDNVQKSSKTMENEKLNGENVEKVNLENNESNNKKIKEVDLENTENKNEEVSEIMRDEKSQKPVEEIDLKISETKNLVILEDVCVKDSNNNNTIKIEFLDINEHKSDLIVTGSVEFDSEVRTDISLNSELENKFLNPEDYSGYEGAKDENSEKKSIQLLEQGNLENSEIDEEKIKISENEDEDSSGLKNSNFKSSVSLEVPNDDVFKNEKKYFLNKLENQNNYYNDNNQNYVLQNNDFKEISDHKEIMKTGDAYEENNKSVENIENYEENLKQVSETIKIATSIKTTEINENSEELKTKTVENKSKTNKNHYVETQNFKELRQNSADDDEEVVVEEIEISTSVVQEIRKSTQIEEIKIEQTTVITSNENL